MLIGGEEFRSNSMKNRCNNIKKYKIMCDVTPFCMLERQVLVGLWEFVNFYG